MATLNDSAKKSLKYLLILDFEATCGDAVRQMEIIEFPTLLYNIKEDKVEATFHEYVRPVVHPTLTRFCTELTGITQETVDEADAFPDVWKRYKEFLEAHELLQPDALDTYTFLTCGDWDLKTMLPRQLRLVEADYGLDESGNVVAPFDRWVNVKNSFRKQIGLRRYNVDMTGMLTRLKLDLVGRHHSGIDDCKNILRIVQKLREEGWDPSTAIPAAA
ncbi:hypothetical protein NM688_g135 [Phlebia brevispora]|uniref:Uncharacterized protein n=1 Tax=Phlebia brevispora TaxID=194682 RepID=A0ACC1TFI5_9APHY|nr:hypothetical protein NM688_g135 [Phlebia brevispora]